MVDVRPTGSGSSLCRQSGGKGIATVFMGDPVPVIGWRGNWRFSEIEAPLCYISVKERNWPETICTSWSVHALCVSSLKSFCRSLPPCCRRHSSIPSEPNWKVLHKLFTRKKLCNVINMHIWGCVWTNNSAVEKAQRSMLIQVHVRWLNIKHG